MSIFTDLLERLIAEVPGGQVAISQRSEEIAQRLRDQGNTKTRSIAKNTFNNIIAMEGTPQLATLHILSLTLTELLKRDVPLSQFIEALGYPIEPYNPDDDRRVRLQQQIASGDETFVESVDALAQLPHEQFAAALSFIAYLNSQRPDHTPQKRRA